jgi:hypothetical protein
MLSAMVIWNIWHPGRYLQGDDCDFPKKVKLSRKEKKMIKQEAKDSKRRGRLVVRVHVFLRISRRIRSMKGLWSRRVIHCEDIGNQVYIK